MMPNRALLSAAVLGVAVGFSINAQAALSDSITLELTELTAVDDQLRVDQFDDMGGTLQLTQVQITLNASLDNGGPLPAPNTAPVSDGTVTNNAANPQDFTVSFRVDAGNYHAAPSAGAPAALTGVDFFSPFDLISSQSYTQLGAGATASYNAAHLDASTVVITITNPADLAAFVGAGQYGYDLSTQILQSISGGGGNIAVDINTYASASIDVAYTSVPVPPVNNGVPLPGTAALLGLGLLGLRRKLAA
ncbi:MAG: choice-of-anchor E domain-containing protein [Chromatiales bacterium]|nr:choice-of-anchor E domain-containing protein [Chromatiales bacterium]